MLGTAAGDAARLRDPATYRDPDRECDVIMKGGITSGVLYPLALCELATTYRLRNVGGTSAGAIAAAAAAAAELGRDSGSPAAGFQGLAALPEWLGTDGHLTGLFRPRAGTRGLHRLLLAVLGRRWGRVLVAALAVALRRWWWPLAGALPGLLLLVVVLVVVLTGGTPVPWLLLGAALALVVATAGLLAGTAAGALLVAGDDLERNLYGIVSGSDGADGGDSLSDWLADQVDLLAGRDPAGPPLTFGELWRRNPGTGERALVLEMLTTNVTEGRPYRLPDELHGFWFRPEELRVLFPFRVVEHLVAHAPGPAVDGLLPLPATADLPVVVATRMSLSFPLLVSAVPLWSVDRSLAACQDPVPPERSWFSDGGITSNFPISFFDALLPTRPTFGINLRPFHPCFPQQDDERGNVWMPRTNAGGILEWWSRWESGRGVRSVVGFLVAIVDTMQNWVDNTQTRVPGYRDRIVHISHTGDQGWLNLTMPEDVLARLAERGRCAGERLVDFYTHPPGVPVPGDDVAGMAGMASVDAARRVVSWENHRWVRLRTSLDLVTDAVAEMSDGFGPEYAADLAADLDAAPSYRFADLDQQALARSVVHGPTGGAAVPAGLLAFAAAVRAVEATGERVPLGVGAPRPAPVLRIAPGARTPRPHPEEDGASSGG